MEDIFEPLVEHLCLRGKVVMYQVSVYFCRYLDTLYRGRFKYHVSLILDTADDSQEWCHWGYDNGILPWSKHGNKAHFGSPHLVGGMDVKGTILTCIEFNISERFYYNNLEYLHADDLHDNNEWLESTALLCLRNCNPRYFLILLPFILVSSREPWERLRSCRDYINNSAAALSPIVSLLLATKSRYGVFHEISTLILGRQWCCVNNARK